MSYWKTNHSHRNSLASQSASLRANKARDEAAAALEGKRAREAGAATRRRYQVDVRSGSRIAFEQCPAVPVVEGRPDPATIALSRGARLGARIGAPCPASATFALVTWLLLVSEISSASAVRAPKLDSPLREGTSVRPLAGGNRQPLQSAARGTNHLRDPRAASSVLNDKIPRRLMQYTGAVVAGSKPIQSDSPVPVSQPSSDYRDTAYPPNPAVGVLTDAMATGQAPSDILSASGRVWARGRFMGQPFDASGGATVDIGHNQYGGVTGVANAHGQFNTDGRYGSVAAEGQASAGVVTMQEQDQNGDTVMHGAAAAQASGSIYGSLPTGSRFYGRGSVSAQAEGTFVSTTGPITETSPSGPLQRPSTPERGGIEPARGVDSP